MDMLITCYLNNRRQDAIGWPFRIVKYLKDNPGLFTTYQDTVTTGIKQTGMTNL